MTDAGCSALIRRLFGLEAEVGTEEVGYYVCALRDVPGTGWILDTDDLSPLFEYHKPRLDTSTNRAAELAVLVVGSIVRHIERVFDDDSDGSRHRSS
jgi:hypothetical protein